MGIPLIQNGLYPWAPSVEGLLNFWTPGQGDGIADFGDARARLNAAATALGLPTIGNDTTAQIRAKINAMIEGTGVPAEADLYMDFLNGRYYGSSAPTDTHATDILALGSGGYGTFAPNVPPITDLGLLTTVGRTNYLKWSNDFTQSDWLKVDCTIEIGQETGPTGALDMAALKEGSGSGGKIIQQGYSVTAGQTYTYSAFIVPGERRYVMVQMAGSALTQTKWVILDTDTGVAAASIAGIDFTIDLWANGYRVSIAQEMDNTGTLNVQIYSMNGPTYADRSFVGTEGLTFCYAGYTQLEEGPFATDPIITEGSAVTRPGNMPVVPVPDGARAFVLDMDLLEPASLSNFSRALQFSAGTDRIDFEKGGDGTWRIVTSIGGSVTGYTGCSRADGRNILYGVFASGFGRMGRIGGDETAQHAIALPPAINSLSFGGDGVTAGANTYMRSRQFAEFRNITDPEAAYAQAKALAQEWAA